MKILYDAKTDDIIDVISFEMTIPKSSLSFTYQRTSIEIYI